MLICRVIRNWRTVSNIALKFAVIQSSALNVSGGRGETRVRKVTTCTNFSKLRKF
jgi:hypothetical protein